MKGKMFEDYCDKAKTQEKDFINLSPSLFNDEGTSSR